MASVFRQKLDAGLPERLDDAIPHICGDVAVTPARRDTKRPANLDPMNGARRYVRPLGQFSNGQAGERSSCGDLAAVKGRKLIHRLVQTRRIYRGQPYPFTGILDIPILVLTRGGYCYLSAQTGKAMNSIITTVHVGHLAAHFGLSESARAFAAASLAENTRRAYAAQWRLWTAHCSANDLSALPADATAVANWIAQRAMEGEVGGKRRKAGARGQAIATLRTALAAIGAAHEANGLAFDSGAAELRMVLKGIRREKAEKIAKAAPLRAGLLMEVIAALGDTPLEVRDAALLSLGYAFARRRSELAGLDLDRLGDGDGVLSSDAHALAVTLVRHKTQAGEPLVSTVPRDGSEAAVKAIERWLALADAKPGEPVLRRILKGGKITAERLHPQSITGIVQRRVAEHFERKGVPAAVAQREAQLFSGHSLRHGFCTTAAEAGASVQAIMSVTGHKSVPIVMGYTAAADRARISPHRIKGVGLSKTSPTE